MKEILDTLNKTIELQHNITIQQAQVLERQLKVIALFQEIGDRQNGCGRCRNYLPDDQAKIETEAVVSQR